MKQTQTNKQGRTRLSEGGPRGPSATRDPSQRYSREANCEFVVSSRKAFVRMVEHAVAFAVIAGLLSCPAALATTPASPSPATLSSSDCSQNLQQIIGEAAPGATVGVPACVYREEVTVDKPLTLDGGGKAEIRGSDVWGEWSRSGDNWVSAKTVPSLTESASAYCEIGMKRCAWPEQVFVDGVAQLQVSPRLDPAPGQFKIHRNRQVVLGSTPRGKTVEVTVRERWLVAATGNVTVKNFTMKHAGNKPQTGAISSNGYDDFVVEDSTLSDVHGAVISFVGGLRGKFLRSRALRGGQLGVHNSKGTVEVRDSEIAYNNTEGYSASWEAGGAKFAGLLRGGDVHSVVADHNHVHDNKGKGLWSDASARNVTFTNNRVHHNDRNGIQLELTDGGKVSGNVLWENGHKKPRWGWGANILISSSKNVEVTDNVVAWGPDGISIISACRSCGNPLQADYDRVTNVSVYHNKILSSDRADGSQSYGLAWLQDWDGVLFDPASNNSGHDNAYWYPRTEDANRYAWGKPIDILAEFNATRGEDGATYLTDAEKTALVEGYALPSAPAG